MKYIFFVLITIVNIFALSEFEPSQTCKGCHPIIYDEYLNSGHNNSSLSNDKIHKAVWNIHPLKKKEKYTCSKCHSPSTLDEGVSCLSCHKIKDVEIHTRSNKNIMTKERKIFYSARQSERVNSKKSYKTQTSWFGMFSGKSGSPFHDIDFSNDNYYNGNVCIGCHSHKQNSKKFDVCNMNIDTNKSNEKENCITCHMPEVEGSFSNYKSSKKHRYHGFPGTIHKPQMLAKYLLFTLNKTDNGFDLIVENRANHALLLHPLRVGELKINIYRDSKKIELPSIKFVRVIGKNSKPSMPWVADEVLKDTQLKAKESRVFHFNKNLQNSDRVEVILGHYIITQKPANKIGIKDRELTKFKFFKSQIFTIEHE